MSNRSILPLKGKGQVLDDHSSEMALVKEGGGGENDLYQSF